MGAGAYARVSTEEQMQNFSIENQLDYLHKYCEQHGYQIAEEYVDPGWSGTTLERPGLTKLMEDARLKLFDIVVVYRLDRLFRSSRHLYNVLDEWDRLGISLCSVTEPFDTATTMGKAYLGMASTFAEWERNTFIERSRDGTRKAIEKGLYSGGIVAYGYRFNPDTKRLEIDEQEAEVIRDIFRWLIEDRLSCYGIAKRLNALGIPTRYGKDGRGIRGRATAAIWRPGRVYNMIRNTAYKGEWIYGKRGKKKQLIKGKCPAIVTEAIFEKAQIRLKENNLWADRNCHRLYLLRGLVKCDLCGHSYSGYYSRSTRNGEIRYYRCNQNGQRGNLMSQRCDSPTITAGLIEDLVWQHISEFVQKPEIVREALQDKFDATNQASYAADLEQARQRFGELNEAESRLLRLYADPSGNYSKEALDDAMSDIKSSRELVRRRIQELEEAMITEQEQSRKLEDIKETLATLKDRIQNATPDIKRQVIEKLLQEIRVSKCEDGTPTLKIVYAFSKDIDAQLPHEPLSVWLLWA
ncbi:recombinase family protein [Chloroflexota bacterium]